jgi:hypothetical protein
MNITEANPYLNGNKTWCKLIIEKLSEKALIEIRLNFLYRKKDRNDFITAHGATKSSVCFLYESPEELKEILTEIKRIIEENNYEIFKAENMLGTGKKVIKEVLGF